ncbi:NapC/NirT family cytochrome c [Polycladidibacter stylochi]|uniref:NapC/NirT family cytochrome c n=1 Tax=Polycladidibacter stylochi TaxID=1807766 RepID=UPI00082F6517|nr:NapC/NirT family cytochrome c [Pseudovibrio stylochi]
MIRRLWGYLWGIRPYPFIIILCVGGLGGIIFSGAFHTALEATNQLEFCTSCHEMSHNLEEYKKTIHYRNTSGVRAECSDCHVPKEFFPKMLRKIGAANDVYHTILGTIDTKEKFEDHRLELAKRVWARMEASDSSTCRSCHAFTTMDIDQQRPKAQKMHKKALGDGSTCIDCHKGIAHEMPDMSAATRQAYQKLVDDAAAADYTKPALTLLENGGLYLGADDKRPAARVLAGTTIESIGEEGDKIKVKVAGWSQEGAEKVIYAQMGQRIFSAALGKNAISQTETVKSVVNEDTGQTWKEVSITGFMDKKNMLEDPEELWGYTSELYQSSCSVCHSPPDPGHFKANQWAGVLKSMTRYTALTKDEIRLVQKYLQLHAADTGGAH